jgi:hypothetical protein
MAEEWRVIYHHPKYQISNIGNVRKQVKDTYKDIKLSEIDGYKYVCLYHNGLRKNCRVHRLVAYAFIGGHPPDKHQIDHIDRNRSNNDYNNLRWCNSRENALNRINNRQDIDPNVTDPQERRNLRENIYRSNKITCVCGSHLSRRWISVHNKTKKHRRALEMNDEIDENENENVN